MFALLQLDKNIEYILTDLGKEFPSTWQYYQRQILRISKATKR